MLVYLDTAHLALLERASDTESQEFWSAWKSCGCELALSLHHLQEIGQLSDGESAARRLQVLTPFQTIRSRPAGFDLVLKLEVQLQFFTLAGYSVDTKRSAFDTLFPLSTASDLARSVEVQPEFKLVRAALEIGAEAANLSKEAARQEPPVDLHAPISPARISSPEMEEEFEKVLLEHAPETRKLMREMFKQVRGKMMEQETGRQALEAIYGLQDVSIRGEIPDSDLAIVSEFFRVAAEAAPSMANRHSPQELIPRLNPYQAPGFALQLAVHRARKLHSKPDEPGDEIDVAHLGFAPYVDLIFVDKRTLGFLTQEARDRPHLLRPEFTRNIHRAGTLNRVAEIILQSSKHDGPQTT